MRYFRVSNPAFVCAILALAAYAVCLHGTYIWDDRFIARDDPRLIPPSHWRLFWTKDYFNGAVDNLYRPMTSMTYAMEKWLHGDRPWIFHLVNWLLHAMVTAIVVELAIRCADRKTAWIAGLIFAVHPVHTEAVIQIVGRAELLCTLFILIALLVFAQRPLTPWRAIGILVCEILAILFKEQGITLPAMLLTFGILVWWRQSPIDAKERQTLKWLIVGVCWVTAGYLIGRESFLRFEWDRHFLDPIRQPLLLSQGINRVLMPVVLVGHYAQLLLFPIRLAPDYSAKVIGSVAQLSDPYLWLGAATIIGWLSAVIVCLRRRASFAAFCLIAAALAYGIVSNLVFLIGMAMGERWAYLPSAFLIIAAAMLLAKGPKAFLIPLLTIAISAALIRDITYTVQWNDQTTFVRYANAQQPRSALLAELVGENLRLSGHPDQAEAFMLKQLPQMSDCWNIWNELGLDAAYQHHFDEAKQYLDRGFKLNIGVAATGQFVDQMKADYLKSHPPATSK